MGADRQQPYPADAALKVSTLLEKRKGDNKVLPPQKVLPALVLDLH